MKTWIKSPLFLAMLICFLVLLGYSRMTGFGSGTKVVRYSARGIVADSGDIAPFAVNAKMDNYPDLIITFHFRQPPSDSLISRLNVFKTAYALKYKAYMGDVTRDSLASGYILFCDFQATPYSQEMFMDLTTGLRRIQGSENISSISIE